MQNSLTLIWQSLNAISPWIFLACVGISLVVNGGAFLQDRRRALGYAARTQEPLSPLQGPEITLLVAAWNEAPQILAFIGAFRRLRYPCKQLVLVAGGEDGTFALACPQSDSLVTVLEQLPGEGKQSALRRGLCHARGEVIFFTDADCLLQDASFERTLQPILLEGEQACSGASHASPDLFHNVFIASQTAVQVYNALYTPQYAPGLFGRNCAVVRTALERSNALQAEVLTGTDYVLAKMLVRADYRIRQNPLSRMVSHFPDNLPEYLRQQRRWMLNVIVHGRRYHARGESFRVLRSAFAGLLMLLLPISALFIGLFPLAAWGALFVNVLFARWRYLGAASLAMGLPFTLAVAAFQPVMLLVDFAAWTLPLFTLLNPRPREVW